MQRTVEEAFFALIRFEMRNDKLCDEIKKIINLEMLPALFKLSKRHDLAHLIGDALDKNGLLPDGLEIRKRFLQERNMAVYRYEQQQYEFQQICEALNTAKIPFIPLKGSIIRRYYPEPWMRTSCDIDILIHKENLDKAVSVLKEKLNYNLGTKGDHDITLVAESGVHLELHYQLVDEDAKAKEKAVLGKVWDNVYPYNLVSKFHYKMADEYFYCYHIAHIAKHLRFGGCGIRSILDTWILNNKVDYNKDRRQALLQEAGLMVVAEAVEKLSEVWFSGAEADGASDSLAQYILMGGVYGSFDNKLAAQKSRKKNKFSYFLSRIFPTYTQMKYKYPRLQKWPILYPFYIVKRWFRLLKKENREKSIKELNEITHANVDKQERIAKLLKDLDL